METLDQFTRKLTDSGLMSVEQLQAFRDTLPPDQKPQAADQLSRTLVEKKILTGYQVDALSSGAPDPLVVGDYVILEKVGAGGMGVVFKAQHRRMKRTVALKMLSTELGKDDSVLRRFEREVEVAAKLHHRNIVAALDAREEQGAHYLIMELVEGRALSTIVESDGALPVADAVDYIVQAATGFAYAHGLGVIHRDIKPANLMLGRDDVVKILDMGLARVELPAIDGLAKTQTHLTNAGIIMGTLDYVSPEQALDSRRVDHRTDIYSLGCTLHYLLVGRSIYPGETPMEILVAHREQPIPSLCDARQGVPAALDATYQRMVAKRPDDRFQSMAEVIEALKKCLASPATAVVPADAEDHPDEVLAEVVDDSTPEVVSATEPAQTARSRRLQSRVPGIIDGWKRASIVLIGKCAGAVLGVFAGLSLGGLISWHAMVVGVLFYLWFGWRCGGGYAWIISHLRGWSNLPPEARAGKLFKVEKLKLHAVAMIVGGIVGVLTGNVLRGIFIGLTVLALADRLQAK
jgi:serine/threonine protein kinase